MTPTTEAGRRLLDWLRTERNLMGREMPAAHRRVAAIEAEARADLLARLRADVEGLRPLVDYEDIPSLRAAFRRILDRAAQP